ncbi:MAG: hypothetical protein Q8P15_03330 [Nanoarchaeota archaeon]|nr:hypothetical protein [Nanoarchaeota archaeon]
MVRIKIKNKIIDAEEMKGFGKFRGLMFRKKSKPLLFRFEKPVSEGIHSFFCVPFKAVWMKNGKIVDERIVKPFEFFVRPKEFFTELVEIPLIISSRAVGKKDLKRM